MKLFYDGFSCAVIDGNDTSDLFEIRTVFKQDCNMPRYLFLLAFGRVMRKTIVGETGIRWNFTSKLDDLDFADDIELLSSSKKHIQREIDELEQPANT